MSGMLKGGTFTNRYVFKAQITALSPLHIGSGEMIERTGLEDDKNKLLQISGVIVDGGNQPKPYIPGSSLRGVMRDWLRDVWGETDREHDELKEKINPLIENAKKKNAKPEEISKEIAGIITTNEQRLELLFGSAFAEGKIEVWDAPCASHVNTPTNNTWSGWKKDCLTYVAKSVAINPKTGTAEDKKLYNFELVPEGACFGITLTGQNLSDKDVALILHALDGFEHFTSPLALGSMTKRGFGRFSLCNLTVYRLVKNEKRDDIKTWKEFCAKDNLAGYDSICRETFKIKDKSEIERLKNLIICPASTSVHLRTDWTLNLETPLVVRSGSSFAWENAAEKKTRNYKMKYMWGHKANKQNDEHDIGDIYFSIRIEGDKAVPYYHIPSSSIRGSLREWTIKHLLPEDWWDIEKGLKKHAEKNDDSYKSLPRYLDDILLLFGFVVKTCDKKLDEKYTCAGRLIIEVSPLVGNYPQPDVDGTWNNNINNPNNYGPTNAKRHIKTRNPLDRITNAAKEKGLHSGLEFSKGQSFTVRLTVENPTDFDRELIDWWCNEINTGMIRFGGLSSIGRGRVTAQEVQDVK
ncbi:MAG: hypothetical protein HY756_08030 [Nitrospirae bacterium]|nr:hypothetical protein [Nitrospirota bacterium]